MCKSLIDQGYDVEVVFDEFQHLANHNAWLKQWAFEKDKWRDVSIAKKSVRNLAEKVV